MRRGGPLGWWTCLLALICVFSFVPGANGQDESGCQLPLSLLGTWYRTNTDSPITFNHTAMLGHQLATAGGLDFTEFTCEYTSEFQYVFAVRNVAASPVDAYFCWKLVRSTDMSFLLYPLTPTADNGTYTGERVVERLKTDPVPSVAEVCSLRPDNVIPTMLYKWSGGIGDIDVTHIASSETQCPNDLLASFDYVKDDTGCSDSDSELDFCKDRATAHVNYTTCRTKILFSEKGVLSCTASFKYSVSTYAMLVNHDSPLNATFRRFVCMKITKHETGQTATVYPGDCSAAIGAELLTLYITKTCVPEVDSGSNLMVMIIGVVVAVNVVALTLVFVAIFCKVRSEREKKKRSYISTDYDRGSPTGDIPTVDKGPNPRIPAILPPLEGQEVKKTPPPQDDDAGDDVIIRKKSDITIAHM